MLREALHYSRLSFGLLRRMRVPPLANPEEHIQEQLRNREARFLELIRQAVFERRGNPLADLFEIAGCEFGDLEREVRHRGLEPTLKALQKQGVYLTHDEFKGKTPIKRGGQTIEAQPSAFCNPVTDGFFRISSSGSRSRGTISRRSMSFMLYREAFRALVDREFGISERRRIQVAPILPSMAGIGGCVGGWRHGQPLAHWFTIGARFRHDWHYRAVTRLVTYQLKLAGLEAPMPQYLPRNDYSPVARCIAECTAGGSHCVVSGTVTTAVRVASAALEKNLDISGTLFFVNGEGLTDPKRTVIEKTGAEVFPSYGMTELGLVGRACRRMSSGNCVHLFHDSIAVINRRRKAPLADVEVDSLMFTPLHPASPYVLVNVEMDDAGVIEECRCDCTFGRSGFNRRIRDIFSYGKLTGQGVTLIGGDLLQILEERLPSRYGGNPSDYQLVEQEGGDQTELVLRVSPRIRPSSTEDVRQFFLRELRKVYGGALACRSWNHTQGLKVVLEEPIVTSSGKVLPLHLLGVLATGRATERAASEDA